MLDFIANQAFEHPSLLALSTGLLLHPIAHVITLHGFRASCGTWCEENGVDKEISKFIKVHQTDYLDAASQRSDLLEKRREVLQSWAKYVTTG